MKEADRYLREIESLRSRLSRLSKASLRITEDLDLDAALQEIADEARSLTGASYAVVATLGESGEAAAQGLILPHKAVGFLQIITSIGGNPGLPRPILRHFTTKA